MEKVNFFAFKINLRIFREVLVSMNWVQLKISLSE